MTTRTIEKPSTTETKSEQELCEELFGDTSNGNTSKPQDENPVVEKVSAKSHGKHKAEAEEQAEIEATLEQGLDGDDDSEEDDDDEVIPC